MAAIKKGKKSKEPVTGPVEEAPEITVEEESEAPVAEAPAEMPEPAAQPEPVSTEETESAAVQETVPVAEAEATQTNSLPEMNTEMMTESVVGQKAKGNKKILAIVLIVVAAFLFSAVQKIWVKIRGGEE